MALEEFQESDTIFDDIVGLSDGDANTTCGYKKSGNNEKLRRKKKSVPMNIPGNHSDNEYEYMYDEDDGRITPPHEIVGRRITAKMAYSVCSGNGRTLKGRHMCEIRDSILRLTGFLET